MVMVCALWMLSSSEYISLLHVEEDSITDVAVNALVASSVKE